MSNKEVIYVDGDDDITTIIDKTTSSEASIIALVLPKKYATLKSSVHMKLLKRTADKSRKKIVLITGEDTLLPLAANAGVFVASSLKSRPEVPKVKPVEMIAKETVVEESDTDLDPDSTLEELAGGVTVSEKITKTSSEKSTKIKQIKESSKIRVPNFDKFRLRAVLIGLGVIALIVGWYVAFFVVPKANVVIQAQTSRVATEVDFTVNPTLSEDVIDKDTVAGLSKEISKTVTERFDATGEKDVGEKAKGTITVQNCDSSETVSLPAGTVFTDTTTSFKFTSNSAATVPGGSFSGGGCSSPGEVDVSVTATQSGDTRNLSSRSYSVAGQSSFITGFGGNMSGGTSEIVKVVSSADIEKATKLLLSKTDDNIRTELALLFAEDDIIIDDSFKVANTNPQPSVKAGDEASEASSSTQFTYSITAIPNKSMVAILEKKQAELVDTTTQSILDSGVDNVKIEVIEKHDAGVLALKANTDGYVGPEIDIAQLSVELEGKRFSEAVDLIKGRPGVKDVDLDLSPFWVFSVPSPNKTTINIEVSDDTLQ